jgi:hypothetical protein
MTNMKASTVPIRFPGQEHLDDDELRGVAAHRHVRPKRKSTGDRDQATFTAPAPLTLARPAECGEGRDMVLEPVNPTSMAAEGVRHV